RWARGRDRARSAGSGLLPGEWHKSPVSDINLMERRAVGLAVREGTEVPTGHLFPGEWHKSRVVDINPLERRVVGLAVRGDTEVPTGSPRGQMAQIASRGDQPHGTTRGGSGDGRRRRRADRGLLRANGTNRESRRSTLWNVARWVWRQHGTPQCRPGPAPDEWH